MRYLRHTHGNGKYHGYDAFIDRESYLDKDSHLFDNADVWQSKLQQTVVAYKSKVRDSVLINCKIGCEFHETEIVKSFLSQSEVRGGTVLGAKIVKSIISDNAVIKGSCVIENSLIQNSAVVEGDAIIRNLTLTARMRVGYGEWQKEPRYFEVGNGNLLVGITESINGYCYIGCQHRLIKSWLRKSKLFSKVAGWNAEMTETTVKTLQEWL